MNLLHFVVDTLLLSFHTLNINENPPDCSSHLVRNSFPHPVRHLLIESVSDAEPLLDVRDHRDPLLLPSLLLLQPFLLRRRLARIVLESEVVYKPVSVVVNVVNIKLCLLYVLIILATSLIVPDDLLPGSFVWSLVSALVCVILGSWHRIF